MSRCSHVQWLELDGLDPHWAIINPDRLTQILTDLAHPDRQCPSIVLFIGKRRKVAALRAIFPHNNVSRRAAHGVANLTVDTSTLASDHPLLLADSTPGAPCTNQIGSWNGCHENLRHKIRAERGILLRRAVQCTVVNLIRPLCHAVCIFTDDVGGNRKCSEYLRAWLDAVHEQQQVSICPPLLLVTTNDDHLDALKDLEHHEKFLHVFASWECIKIESTGQHEADRQRLQSTIRSLLDAVRQRLSEQKLLFTARHLARLFKQAVAGFCQDPNTTPDLLQVYRHPAVDEPISSLPTQVDTMLASRPADDCAELAIVANLAAVLLVQAYPPGHHRESRRHVVARQDAGADPTQILHQPCFSRGSSTPPSTRSPRKPASESVEQ